MRNKPTDDVPDSVWHTMNEVLWLCEGGISTEQACRRVGVTLTTVSKYAWRYPPTKGLWGEIRKHQERAVAS